MTLGPQWLRAVKRLEFAHAIPTCVWSQGALLVTVETRRWASSRRWRKGKQR